MKYSFFIFNSNNKKVLLNKNNSELPSFERKTEFNVKFLNKCKKKLEKESGLRIQLKFKPVQIKESRKLIYVGNAVGKSILKKDGSYIWINIKDIDKVDIPPYVNNKKGAINNLLYSTNGLDTNLLKNKLTSTKRIIEQLDIRNKGLKLNGYKWISGKSSFDERNLRKLASSNNEFKNIISAAAKKTRRIDGINSVWRNLHQKNNLSVFKLEKNRVLQSKMEKMYFQNLKPYSSIRNIIAESTKNFNFNNYSSRQVQNVLKKLNSINSKSLNDKNNDFQELKNNIEKIGNLGWCTIDVNDLEFIRNNRDKSDKFKMTSKIHYYNKNKTLKLIKQIISEINNDEFYLNKGYITEIKDMFEILKQNYDLYYLFCGDIFAICEYIFFRRIKDFLSKKNNFLNFAEIKGLKKNYFDHIQSYSTFYLYYASVVKVMYKFWKSKNTKRPSMATFRRDTVQHGFIDPSKIKRSDFAKIIVLLYAIISLKDPHDVLEK